MNGNELREPPSLYRGALARSKFLVSFVKLRSRFMLAKNNIVELFPF